MDEGPKAPAKPTDQARWGTERVDCPECGKTYRRSNKYQHVCSEFHLAAVKAGKPRTVAEKAGHVAAEKVDGPERGKIYRRPSASQHVPSMDHLAAEKAEGHQEGEAEKAAEKAEGDREGDAEKAPRTRPPPRRRLLRPRPRAGPGPRKSTDAEKAPAKRKREHEPRENPWGAHRVDCPECGKRYRRSNKAQHCRSLYHLDAMKDGVCPPVPGRRQQFGQTSGTAARGGRKSGRQATRKPARTQRSLGEAGRRTEEVGRWGADRIDCPDCGVTYRRSNQSQHLRSLNHLAAVKDGKPERVAEKAPVMESGETNIRWTERSNSWTLRLVKDNSHICKYFTVNKHMVEGREYEEAVEIALQEAIDCKNELLQGKKPADARPADGCASPGKPAASAATVKRPARKRVAAA